ncbi:hypothetical protein K523DRAFT_422034 [Schizophyllum commune Tattone D]|nr:hypothetical protein K523DRAFT_422034 [Schizophyllum commune Tattone D]
MGAQGCCLQPAPHAESGLDMVYKTSSMLDDELPTRFFFVNSDSEITSTVWPGSSMNATYYTSAVYDLPNAGAGNLNVGSMGWC